MYYQITCAGISAEFRRDKFPDEKTAKRLIINYYKSTLPIFDKPDARERLHVYQEIDHSPVKIMETGDDEKYAAHRALETAPQQIRELYQIMVAAYEAGNTAVRRSRGASRETNTGIVIFADHVHWPRYNPDDPADYWSHESKHLAYNNINLARHQIRSAGLELPK